MPIPLGKASTGTTPHQSPPTPSFGRRSCGVGVPFALYFLLQTAFPLHAIEPELVKCVPPGALAAYWLDPSSTDTGDTTANSGSLVTYMVDNAQHLGLLSKLGPGERAWLDGFAAMAVVRQFPHAVILLDIRSETRDDGGEQLSGIRAAIAIQTNDRNDSITRIIQNGLKAYTNSEESKLETEGTEDGEVFTLRDRRLPDWAPITWGRVRSLYVIAIGTDAFNQVATRVRLGTDGVKDSGWFADAFKMAKGRDASFALSLNFEAIHKSSNPSLYEKIKDVQGGLHLAETKRALWTLGASDRSVEVRAVRRVGDRDVVNVVADSGFLDRFGADVVPKEATRFAIVDWEPKAAFETICDTYLAVESPSSRRAVSSFWTQVESESGVKVAEDIFGRLGSSLLIHNHPQQAFGLPLGLTFVVPVKEASTQLRASVDRLLSQLDSRYLAHAGCYRFRQDPDGIWAIDFGLKGPAIVVQDNWVVLSFSPYGVRENLARLPKLRPTVSLDPHTEAR